MRDDYDEAIDLARAIPMLEILDRLGLESPNSTGHIRSIFNDGERTPSLHIDTHLWYDFSTGQGGDSIKFVQGFFGCTFNRAVQWLSLGEDPLSTRDTRRETAPQQVPDLREYFDDHTVFLFEDKAIAEVVEERWPISFSWLAQTFDVRVNKTRTELWAPHFDREGRVTAIKIRALESRDKWCVPGSKFVDLYHTKGFDFDGRQAWLVEGESDCWALSAKTFDPVFALPSGAGMWKPEWVEQLAPYSHVYIALDDDDAGRRASTKIADQLPTSTVVEVPGGRVAEAIADGWTPNGGNG